MKIVAHVDTLFDVLKFFPVNSERYSLFCFGAISIYFISISIVVLYVVLIYVFHDNSWYVFFMYCVISLHMDNLRVIQGGSSYLFSFIILLVSMLQFVTASLLLTKKDRIWREWSQTSSVLSELGVLVCCCSVSLFK